MWGIEKLNRVMLIIFNSSRLYDFSHIFDKDAEYVKLIFEANEKHPNPNTKGHYIIDKNTGALEEYYTDEDLSNTTYEQRSGYSFRTSDVTVKVNFKKQESDRRYYMHKAKINLIVELLDGEQKEPTIYEAEYIWITLDNTDAKIKKNASVKKDVFKLDHPYNEDFWQKQNILPLTQEMETFINKSIATDTKKRWTNIHLGE